MSSKTCGLIAGDSNCTILAIGLDQGLSHLLANVNRAYFHHHQNPPSISLGGHVGCRNLCEHGKVNMLCTPSSISL